MYSVSAYPKTFSTIIKFICDILGEKVSRNQQAKVIQKVSMSLEKLYQELLGRLPLKTVLNIDETGHKENGGIRRRYIDKQAEYYNFI